MLRVDCDTLGETPPPVWACVVVSRCEASPSIPPPVARQVTGEAREDGRRLWKSVAARVLGGSDVARSAPPPVRPVLSARG